SARSNQNNDRAGFDNVRLYESSTTNDSCSNATTLIVGTDNTHNIISGDNSSATDSGELPNPTCGNYAGRDLWYTALVPSSGILTVEVTSTQIDPAVAVYTGSCGTLTQLACNDDINWPSNPNSRIELIGLPNTTVYIRVWSYNDATSGVFDIVAFSAPVPSNNDCANATILTVGSTNTENVVTGTNVGATGTNPPPNPNCDGYLGGDVWYIATIPGSGILNIETSNAGGITDTGLAVYTGSCGSLTQIDCDADSGPGFFSVINLTGLPNTTVYIRVWEYQNNNFGEFNIVAYSPDCPFSTTWNGNNWNNGIPDEFTSVSINGNYNTGLDGSFDSCDCTINNGDILTISPNTYVLVDQDLIVNGTLEVEHEGSLVMVDNSGSLSVNGTINIHKTSTPFNQYDYMYWSSPTSSETIGSALATSEASRIYRWDHQNGWIFTPGSTSMGVGAGYIAMGDTSGSFPKTQSVVFDGPVNTGTIATPIGKSPNIGITNFDWNLIGNPYPSAIDANVLLNDPRNTSTVKASIYLWTHNTQISELNPGPDKFNYSSNDYASYTAGTGGVAAVSGGPVPNGFIASGQAFFIQALAAGTITYDNAMRVTGNNNQLFRGNKKNSTDSKNRVWLDMKNDEGAFSQILIGFIEGATDGIDRNFDGARFWGNSYLSFYSITDENYLAINGKKPITDEESIKLGFYSTINAGDSLKISIANLEGRLNEYAIYLKDHLLDIIHDLSISDYEFVMEEKGVFNERFELLLSKSGVLATEDFHSLTEELILINKEDYLEVKTLNSTLITSLNIYDLLGKTILRRSPNNNRVNLDITNIKKGTVLIVNATLENNQKITMKFLIN
ncbi:MAG: T9SS type A sorting domain-containing protein, partial [Flavobacteriaceae bacterium]|nr:T9SS type A sorting domain-containing protein [Flavobacteriaceae bacterium]